MKKTKKTLDGFVVYIPEADVTKSGSDNTYEVTLDACSVTQDLLNYQLGDMIETMTCDQDTIRIWAEEMVEAMELSVGLHHFTDVLPKEPIVEELEERGLSVKIGDIFAEDMTAEEFRLFMCDIFRVGNYTSRCDIFVLMAKKLLGETIV